MNTWEVTREEINGHMTYLKLMLMGTYSVGRLLVTSPGDFRKFGSVQSTGQRYIRPARKYELPEYHPEMKSCRSNEKFLRPTRYCNSQAPEVIAMAHQLGSYRLSEAEYTRAAFEFVKEQMPLEICPIDDVGVTLRRGTGTCFHLISVFIALCRAAGIKARYKMFSQNMVQAWREVLVDVDPLVKKWYDSLGYFLIEGEGEALVDGRWTVAHVGPTAERQAAAGLPVTRLGEDAIGLWFIVRPGTIMRLESIPFGLGVASRMLFRLAPGSIERVNLSVQDQEEAGRRLIARAGGVEAYDQQVRAALGSQGPSVSLDPRKEIIFGG